MYLEIDFNSDEAFYVQLCNQIIIGIATSKLQEGDALPSVRQLADEIGINMHTVNKAYALLRQDQGYGRDETGTSDDACKRKLQKYYPGRSTSAD